MGKPDTSSTKPEKKKTSPGQLSIDYNKKPTPPGQQRVKDAVGNAVKKATSPEAKKAVGGAVKSAANTATNNANLFTMSAGTLTTTEQTTL